MENHPLIKRQQTYLLDRKIVSIHSNDRDINKWPNSNHFEVTLPENMTNIDSMRLININLPNQQYVFSNEYQNTKFNISIEVGPSGESYEFLADNSQVEITITEGFYTPKQLEDEIKNQLNTAFTSFIIDASSATPSDYEYVYFTCKYIDITHKFAFGNHRDNFTLHFDKKIDYTINCNQKVVWDNYSKWGFPSYLGFEKKEYDATAVLNKFGYLYDNTADWLVADASYNSVYYIESPLLLDIFGENCVYMEVDKYNSMDELVPYVENTSSTFNNDYSAITNSAFAKIPNIGTPFSQIYDSRNGFLNNMKIFQTPLPKISKLRFTFRFHDGRLVDFRNLPFDFSLEFNQVRNVQMRNYLLQVPPTYSL